VRTHALGVALLLAAGCATRAHVRTEVGGMHERLAADVGRLVDAHGQMQREVDALAADVAALRAGAEAARERTRRAADTARAAHERVSEAAPRAGDATRRADRATAVARDALARAAEVERRLDTLRARYGRRALQDTLLVHFGFDRWTLDDRAQTILLGVAERLLGEPALTVELEGYTDDLGAPAYNVRLGERRAESVRRFLVGRGVELRRIQSIGFGAIHPVADNKTRLGREQNRRVVVRLFAPAD
jgi:outer membrane protein OmpA-like peptidoglycan-associated protein